MSDVKKPAPPRHIAIIMDGNGRWAKKRGLPRTAGHSAGAEAFRRIANYCRTLGVEYLTVYAFSTENWKRSEEEVGGIMRLLGAYLKEAIRDMEKTAAGIVFLDTADYLLVTESAMEEVESIKEHLKPSVRVCIQHVEMNLKDAAAYLSVHRPEHQLRSCQDPQSLQILTEESGKVILK